MSTWWRVPRVVLAALIATAAAGPLAMIATADRVDAAGERPVVTMYVPFKEVDVHRALFGTGSLCTSCSANQDVRTTIGITIAADDTTIYYDHWEDGYEDDIANPAPSSTTRIWGDANPANGAPPGIPGDVLDAGDVIILQDVVDVTLATTPSRNPATRFYDGGDKIAATRGVAVTRAGWGSSTGTLHAGAVAASDLSKWGTRFSIPVGTNLATTSSAAFDYVAASISASTDGTVVEVDANADGTFETSVVLNQGDSHFTGNGLRVGANVRTNQPVQVHLLTGDINDNYESRWFEVFPDELLDDEYVAAVGKTAQSTSPALNVPVSLLLHNPNNFPIVVDVQDTGGTTAITIPPRQTAERLVPLNSGAYVSSTEGRFAAISAIASAPGTPAQSSAYFDWGYSLVPVRALTSSVVIGWAPGTPASTSTGGATGTSSRSPVWVAPVAATTIVVDYQGDGTRLSAPISIAAYESRRISDPVDHDMTGARITTTDGTLISVAWGQDASTNQPTDAYDLGITVLPSPDLVVTKTVRLVVADGDDPSRPVRPGDTLEYTVELVDVGAFAITQLAASDPLPDELIYVPGSARQRNNYVDAPVADSVTGTAFPFDEWGITSPRPTPATSGLDPGEVATYTYRVTVDPALTPSGEVIRNTVYATSYEQQNVTATANVNVWFPGLYTTKTATTAGPLSPGDQFDYVVTVTNTGSAVQHDVTVTDTLPAGVTWQSATVSYPTGAPGASVHTTETWGSFSYDSTGDGWTGAWSEVDALGGGASAGNVQVVNDHGSNRLRMTGAAQRLQRTIDASYAVSGTVSYDYRQVGLTGLPTEEVVLEVSEDGVTWHELDAFGRGTPGNELAYGSASASLPGSVLGGDVTFRWTVNGLTAPGKFFYFDNFKVDLPGRAVTTVPATGPVYGGPAVDLLEDEQFVVRITAQVDERVDAADRPITNVATSDSVQSDLQTASVTLDMAPIRIGDRVWEDTNGNGVQDVGEPGLAGVEVTLLGEDQDGEPVSISVTTDAGGNYLFDNLLPGTYDVQITSIDPTYVAWFDRDGTADGAVSGLTVNWGDEIDDADFGYLRPGSVSGVVFRDLDNDGVFDVGEPGLEGVTLTLTGPDGDTFVSGPGGAYTFLGLRPGTYSVAVDGAGGPGTLVTTSPIGPFTIVSGQHRPNVDFGFRITTGIEIAKQLDMPSDQVAVGGVATFEVTITNTGSGTLSNLVVSDPLAPNCDALTISSLAQGASHTYSCSAPGWTEDENVIGVTALDQWGSTVSDGDTEPVTLIDPRLEVSITPDQAVIVNGAAAFTVVVTNTGDVTLTDVDVTTSLAGDDCNRSSLTLAAGASQSWPCTFPGVLVGATNTANAAGSDPNGHAVVATPDSADITVLHPALTITKSPATQTVRVGQPATFTIEVTNTGQTPLTGITVADATTPDCAGEPAFDLGVGGSHTFSCAHPGVTGDFVNEASATGTYLTGHQTTSNIASATVLAIDPGINIHIVPSAPVVALNGPVTWTITVTNGGDTPLTGVVVDADRDECDLPALTDPLLPGADHTYTCVTPDITGLTAISGVTTGLDPNLVPVSDTAGAQVTAAPASVSVVKETVETGPFPYGADVEFRITVTNTSITPLTNVVVDDPLTADCDGRAVPGLAALAQQVVYCTATDVLADFVNEARVTGDDPLGGEVESNWATAPVDVLVPSISVTKQADHSAVPYGGTVTWTITIENDGEAVLHDVVVLDDLAPGCNGGFANLVVDEIQVVTCATSGLNADITNTAAVTAEDSAGNEVGDSAQAAVTVGEPAHVIGRVWDDVDGDGLQDAGEPGIDGVAVTLRDADGDELALTSTDSDGAYDFGPLPPGDYSVAVSRSGMRPTVEQVGADRTIDSDVASDGTSDVVNVAAGDTAVLDAGLYTPAVIGDQVWFDDDLDGTFDADEDPATGITVTATWHGLDGALGTADDETFTLVTDSDGVWRLDDAAPGAWTISIGAPTDWESLPVSLIVQSGSVNLDGDVPLRRIPMITRVTFTPVCVADIPYVDYAIEVVGTLNDTATLTFTAADGDVAQVLTGMPLSGRVLYPGASTAPDWPGWMLQGDTWVPDPTDADWRNGLDVTVEVNPTATGHVTYPAATEACFAPASSTPTPVPVAPVTPVTPSPTTDGATVPTNPPAAGSDTTSTARANELPSTGSDAATITTIAAAACLIGLVLFSASRRRAHR